MEAFYKVLVPFYMALYMIDVFREQWGWAALMGGFALYFAKDLEIQWRREKNR